MKVEDVEIIEIKELSRTIGSWKKGEKFAVLGEDIAHGHLLCLSFDSAQGEASMFTFARARALNQNFKIARKQGVCAISKGNLDPVKTKVRK